MPEAWIVEAVRTPIGKHGGALASVRPDDLLAHALSALMDRSGVPKEEVEDVYAGCANQAGEDNRNVARMALLLAGFPVEVAGCTVNRLCGSGLEAVAQAARAIWAGEGKVYIGSGVESMSRAPYAVPKPERGFPTGNLVMYDTTLGWRFVNPKMQALYGTESMGETAENLAEMYKIPREEQDRFALLSHQKAVRAWDEGRFQDEVVPVPVKRGKEEILVEQDEGPRRDTSLEKLAALRPVFREGGTVTAGNSSPLNDGAAAVLLVSDDYAKAHGLRPLARVRAIAVAGVPPRIMGIGPVPATRKALERAGLSLSDLGLIELNEAFAAQSLAVLREWGLDMEDPRLNPNGGAIWGPHPHHPGPRDEAAKGPVRPRHHVHRRGPGHRRGGGRNGLSLRPLPSPGAEGGSLAILCFYSRFHPLVKYISTPGRTCPRSQRSRGSTKAGLAYPPRLPLSARSTRGLPEGGTWTPPRGAGSESPSPPGTSGPKSSTPTRSARATRKGPEQRALKASPANWGPGRRRRRKASGSGRWGKALPGRTGRSASRPRTSPALKGLPILPRRSGEAEPRKGRTSRPPATAR